MMENWPDLRADNPLPLNKAGVPSKRKMSRFPYKEITVAQCICNHQPLVCPYKGKYYVNPRIPVDSEEIEENTVLD